MKYLLFLCISLLPFVFSFEITEVMYNPPGYDSDYEWIEIYNPDNTLIHFYDPYFLADSSKDNQLVGYSDTNSTYLIIASCYSYLYDSLDQNDILNPISFDEFDEYGVPICDKIGNNLQNTKDDIELWYCPTTDDLECDLLDEFYYNDSMGADGNGLSLQKINGTWYEAVPTPGQQNTLEKKLFKIEIKSEQNLFTGVNYTNILKASIKNKQCFNKENITVTYNITDDWFDLLNQKQQQLEIGCSKSFGNIYFEDPGTYELCAYLNNKQDCQNLNVVDSKEIPCDISINITTNSTYYPNSIKFIPEINDETYPFKITYWFENKTEIIKQPKTTFNSNRKSYKPRISKENNIIYLNANISPMCDDINLSNNLITIPINYSCQIFQPELNYTLITNQEYLGNNFNLFRVENLNYTPCNEPLNTTINYTINNQEYQENIILKKSKSVAKFQPNSSGTFEVCTNNICNNITIIDPFSIPCNITFNLTTQQLFNKTQKFKFGLNNKTYPFKIEYWIEDLFGNIKKDKSNTTNTNQKSYTPKTDEIDQSYIIKANLLPSCDDQDITDNYVESLITLKNKEPISSSYLTIINPEKTFEFGDTIQLKLNIYKGDTTKNAFKIYLKNNKQISDIQTKFSLYTKFKNYTLIIPLKIPDNCDSKYLDGNYNIYLEGLGLNTTQQISVSGVSCTESTTSTKSSQDAYTISYIKDQAYTNEMFYSEVEIYNKYDKTLDYEIWSYLYRGSKCYSDNGIREFNKIKVSIPSEKSMKINLQNHIGDIKEGKYNYVAKILKEDNKNAKNLKETIFVNEKIKKEKTIQTLATKCKDKTCPSLPEVSNPRIAYESSSIKAYKATPYLLIGTLTLFCIYFILKL